MDIYESGGQVVRSWASILDPKTLQQALMTARCDAMAGPLALMPDAHLGAGSTVGSVLLTEGIIPALEPAHALAHVAKIAGDLPKDHLMVMNMCGRGDKDVFTVAEALGVTL